MNYTVSIRDFMHRRKIRSKKEKMYVKIRFLMASIVFYNYYSLFFFFLRCKKDNTIKAQCIQNESNGSKNASQNTYYDL